MTKTGERETQRRKIQKSMELPAEEDELAARLALIEELRTAYPNARRLEVPVAALEWSQRDVELFFESLGEIAPRSAAEEEQRQAEWRRKLARDADTRVWLASEKLGLAAALRPEVVEDKPAWTAERLARRGGPVPGGECLGRVFWTDKAERGPRAGESLAMLVRPPTRRDEPRAVASLERCGAAAAGPCLERHAEAVRSRLRLAARMGAPEAVSKLARGGWLKVCAVGGLDSEDAASDSSDDSLLCVASLGAEDVDAAPPVSTMLSDLPSLDLVVAFEPSLNALATTCRALAGLCLATDTLWRHAARRRRPDAYAGGFRDVAMARHSRLRAWGDNAHGQLGLGDRKSRLAPTRLDIEDVVCLDASHNISAAALLDGSIWVWGIGFDAPRRVGDGDDIPVDIEIQYVGVLARYRDRSERVFWFSQHAASTGAPVAVRRRCRRLGVVAAAITRASSALVTTSGRLFVSEGHDVVPLRDVRGADDDDDDPGLLGEPRLVDVRVVQVAAGHDFFCALASDGRVFAFGDNKDDRRRWTNSGAEPSPRPVEGLRDVVWIGAGLSFAAALDDDGALYVWGHEDAVLTQPRSAPYPVWPLADFRVTMAACGHTHILALTVPRKPQTALAPLRSAWFVKRRHWPVDDFDNLPLRGFMRLDLTP